MTERLEKICALLEKCETFADVGCDHGYCARYMLNNGLCSSAVITDVSAKSLSKAERLLESYIKGGRCRSICCDGLEGVEEGSADLVLIAGMGGEEILKIIKNSYIPRKFVFQPMKNGEALRAYLLKCGCAIDYDGIFSEERGGERKFYFVIKGKREGGNEKPYSRAELSFGRDSLGTGVLNKMLEHELERNSLYASARLSAASRKTVEERIAFLKGVLSGEIK